MKKKRKMKTDPGTWWTVLFKYLQKGRAGGKEEKKIGSANRKSLELVNSLTMENKRKGVSNVTLMSGPDNPENSGIINRNKKIRRKEPNF